jgi:hypothetical protein
MIISCVGKTSGRVFSLEFPTVKPISIHPFFLWSALQICRWGRRSSRAATSLSNPHDNHVHNQEFQSSLGSYIHPENFNQKDKQMLKRKMDFE